ncbi:MAG: hypothetical protein JWP57_1983 [Spirosoma sp.]|nr:hypothetical protein [Spirosoma sp.]
MPTVSFNQHFPGYDVLGEINRSNARVLKARHIATGDLVAIKHFSLNTDADTLRRFERESVIMTQMEHPNIVRVREVRLDAELPYIVMDYVDGGSVRKLITEQGSLSVEMTIRLGLQVLSAFRVIHSQGIVHRDVKPENILYHKLASGELHFLLTDFGVARLHQQPVTMTGQSLMTYEYAAPEQFDNPRHVDEAADYYAFGVVLYECLTGQVPFPMRGETGMATFMNAVLTLLPPEPVLPANQPLPTSLDTLIRQLLIKNPTERIHNPDLIKLALKQAEVEQLHQETGQLATPQASRNQTSRPVAPVGATRPAPVVQPPRPATANVAVTTRPRRRIWPMVVLTGVVLLAGVAAAYWLSSKSDRPEPVGQTPTESVATAAKPNEIVTDDPAREAEEAQRRADLARQRYMEQVAEAEKQLEATAFGGRTGLFGGVKGLSVRLVNPSVVTFKQVAVQVEYVKENGDLFKSTIMYFNKIGPDADVVRKAPDSQRGTTFNARVLRADAVRPDSISTTFHNP